MSRLRFALAFMLLAGAFPLLERGDLPWAAAQEKPQPEPELERVLPVFEPGTHTRPVTALGFTKDGRRLVTVGEDLTVQVWNAASGERVDLIRLPGYGSEKVGSWGAAAVSADGSRVAIGGSGLRFQGDGSDKSTIVRLLLVDVAARSVQPIDIRGPGQAPVRTLAFSPDGNTLAIALDGKTKQLLLVDKLTRGLKKQELAVRMAAAVNTSHTRSVTRMTFSPDGKRLVASGDEGVLSLWDVTPDGAGLKLAKEIPATGISRSLAWTRDGKQILRGARGLEVWNTDGTAGKSFASVPQILESKGQVWMAKPLDDGRLALVAQSPNDKKSQVTTSLGILDLASGETTPLGTHEEERVGFVLGATSADGKRSAFTANGATEALLFSNTAAGEPIRCGSRTQIPFQVGWSRHAEKPGFAWSEVRRAKNLPPSIESLSQGFDLTAVRPLETIDPAEYQTALRKVGDWTLKARPKGKVDDPNEKQGLLLKGGKDVRDYPFGVFSIYSLVPQGDRPPLVAFSNSFSATTSLAVLTDSEGKAVAHLKPHSTILTSMAPSPDGRFLVTNTGTARLNIHATDAGGGDNRTLPLLSHAQVNGEWVIWTPEGYYAASPGGEKFFGWTVNNGPGELATFHPAERFAKHFRRPDVIRLAIEKGSVAAALEALKTKPPAIEQILPPQARLALVEQRGSLVKVKASAQSAAKGKPVQSMRVMLDGRPLGNDRGLWAREGDAPAEITVEVEIPPGPHELLVLARSDDGPTVSDPLRLLGPKAPGKQPTLHRICVGINDYDAPALRLGAASKDARAIFAALEASCVGPNNLFGQAQGALILDKEATRTRLLKALADVRREAVPGDLVVFFFAGHGKRQKGNYFLLTRESDDSKDLLGQALSGDDLRKVLEEIECPVLMLLDACESANAVLSFQLATDDLRRDLGDEKAGVTILGAAQAQEEAKGSAEQGYFTAALLKALKAGEGVPFDRYERTLYVHHLFDVAFSEVREATRKQKKIQNPFLHVPWTAPPLAVRAVPVR